MKRDLQTPGSSSLDEAEPKAIRRPAPVWIFVALLLLLYLSMVYFDRASAWFNAGVYAPYKSLAHLESFQPRVDANANFELGRKLFSINCAVCHMENGIGNPGNGCPPLVGSEWLAAPGIGRVVRLVSKGLTGPLEVKGQTYGTGTMMAIGDQLPGDESERAEAIAAIVGYVRKTFGNNSVPVSPEAVKAIREQIKGHNGNFISEELKVVPDGE
jgi:mono/diheme cytochrome c family protein